MDESNKKMEDFFNKSLEQFNDSPSDSVWEGLADRLEEEETFFQRWGYRLQKYLPIMVLLCCWGAYHFYTLNKIDDLKLAITTVQKENQELNKNLIACATNSNENATSELITETTPEKKSDRETKSNSTTIIPTKEKSITKSINNKTNPSKTVYPNPPTYITQTNSTPIQTPTITSTPTPSQLQTKINIVIDQSTPKTNTKTNFKQEISSPNQKQSNQKQLTALPKLPTWNILTPVSSRPSISHGLGLIYIKPFGNPEYPTRSKYRIGYNYSISTLRLANSKGFNISNGNGVKQELKIASQWSLTNTINFNQQSYKIKASSGNLFDDVVAQYPNTENLGEKVNQIRVQSKYFDIPLGIKWTLGLKTKGLRYFINPSVVWKVYLPQKFTYTLANTQEVEFRDRRKFAYFGSGNLQIGLEKKVRPNVFWQLGLWGEWSFIPLGVEEQSQKMLGLSTSVLFGK